MAKEIPWVQYAEAAWHTNSQLAFAIACKYDMDIAC